MSFLATVGFLAILGAIAAGFYVGNSDFRTKVDAILDFFKRKPGA